MITQEMIENHTGTFFEIYDALVDAAQKIAALRFDWLPLYTEVYSITSLPDPEGIVFETYVRYTKDETEPSFVIAIPERLLWDGVAFREFLDRETKKAEERKTQEQKAAEEREKRHYLHLAKKCGYLPLDAIEEVTQAGFYQLAERAQNEPRAASGVLLLRSTPSVSPDLFSAETVKAMEVVREVKEAAVDNPTDGVSAFGSIRIK